jgi:hypothetical protein
VGAVAAFPGKLAALAAPITVGSAGSTDH